MEIDDWLICLVFEAPDGSFFDEPRRYRARLDEAVARARLDAEIGAFGRTFKGFSKLELAPPLVSSDQVPLALHVPTNPAQPMDELLAKHKVSELAPVTVQEPARHPLAFDALERFPWWDFNGAFGPATEVGVDLLRSACVDPELASAAAEHLGECIAHQQQLFPVTAHALPWIVTLLESKDVGSRAVLAKWLEAVADSAEDARDTVSRVLAFTARLVARELADAMSAHQASAKAVLATLRGLQPRLEALKEDPVIGERIAKVLGFI